MTNVQRRTKVKHASTSSAKERIFENEQIIPNPSRQGHLNEQTDFASDPSLMFDDLPQPFRRINKVLQSIFDDAWTIIEQREQQRMIDQSKFVTAQHTSSTLIKTSFPITVIGSHIHGTLCFFSGNKNELPYILCYDNQVDEIINEIQVDHSLKHIHVIKSDSSPKDTTYFLSIIDNLGYWKMIAYKNQKYYLLFTQYENDDDNKRPLCLTSQAGLNDDYLVVSWFGNNDSWLEVYKVSKEQWKTEITTLEQAMAANESQIELTDTNSSSENGPGLIRGQFSRPTLLFKARAPKFSSGSNNYQQLMKNTENQSNIGQGTTNHFYTQQIIDTKTILIKDLLTPTKTVDSNDRTITILKPEPLSAIIPCIVFIPAGAATSGGSSSLAVTWPTTNQLLIYKLVKSESKGKDALDTRPSTIWPFASQITCLSYDSKHEHLAVALRTGNVCIIERTAGVNDLPSVQHISSSPVVDIHGIDSLEYPFLNDTQNKHNGFLVLSNDGKIYRVKYQSILNENSHDGENTLRVCFPQEQSKDASRIVRMIFFHCNPANLFLTINEIDRIYINDALKCKQLCEIVLSHSFKDDDHHFQIAFIDNARSIIIGVPENINQTLHLRLYRVPLEHFPSLEHYYPERVASIHDEIEHTIETKPSKATNLQNKKGSVVVELDKTQILFDEKIKEMFHLRQSQADERRERLRNRWNELKNHINPVHEQKP